LGFAWQGPVIMFYKALPGIVFKHGLDFMNLFIKSFSL